jgi:hypothetical protein
MATRDKSKSLQQAASTMFVLMTILPLLVFTWTLHTLDVLQRNEAQIGLALSLVLALSGFFILRSTMGRLSQLTQALSRAVERRPDLPRVPLPEHKAAAVAPGIGSIGEFEDMTATMAALWKREALSHIGRQVSVSVVRATEPLSGTLKEVSASGLLLERDGKEIAVNYQRISGIEVQ